MKRLYIPVLGLLFLLAASCSMKNAAQIKNQSQSISLRYQQPISTENAVKDNGLTAWRQDTVTLFSEYREAESKALFYSGDAFLVYGASCAKGGLPAPLDKNGCAVSAGLAHQLFGSEDAVGLALNCRGRNYSIRGVFEGEEPLALLPAEESRFTAVELAYTKTAYHDPEGWINQQLKTSGLPHPDWVLYPGDLTVAAVWLAWLPIGLSGMVLARSLWKKVRGWHPAVRHMILFLLLLMLALALPIFFSMWPQWLTPSRWSDFSWWTALGQQLHQRIQAWVTSIPAGRDVVLKMCFLEQMDLAAFQCILWEVLRCKVTMPMFAEKAQETNTEKIAGATIR